MRRFFVSAVACLLAGCADRPATAIVAAVAADDDTLHAVRSIRMRAYRGTELRHELILPPQTLDHPGTLTYRDHTDGDSHDSLRFVIDGLSTPPPEPNARPAYGKSGQSAPGLTPQAGTQVDEGDPAVLVRRSARLSFVKEKSKLLRLGLSASCLGVPCEQATETCKAGRCVDDTEDPNALPDAGGDLGGVDYGGFTDLPDGSGGAGGIECNGTPDEGKLYVNAKAPAGCSDDAACGDREHPNCTLGAAILSAKAKLANNSGNVTIYLPATSGDVAYEGSVLLPAGVSLSGGHDGTTWGDAVIGTTTIRAKLTTSFVDDSVSEGSHTRSTIHVADSSAGSSVSLRNLVVEMPSSDVVTEAQAKLDQEPYLTAGIHLSGSTNAELTNITVIGKPGVVLKESTEGIYVSSGGTALLSLATSTVSPPASQFGHSSAVKIENDANSSVTVCDSTLTGGRALADGRSSAGLRVRGGGKVALQSKGCSGATGLSSTIAGGLATTSHGVSLEGATSLSIQSGVTVLGLQPSGGQAWPGTVTEVAAVALDPLRTSTIEIAGATLVGLAKSEGLTAPSNTSFYGLKADAGEATTGLASTFSFQVQDATLLGAGGLAKPTECQVSYGVYLHGPPTLTASSQAPVATFVGGEIHGGDACLNRKAADVANLDVVVPKPSSQEGTRFRGTEEKGGDCDEAVGLAVATRLTVGTVVKGGAFEGGEGCRERVGVRAGGVSLVEGVTASGVAVSATSDTSAQRLVGVEVVEVANGDFLGDTAVASSSMTGGHMAAPETLSDADLVYAVGLRLAIDRGALVSSNEDIVGCALDCQGAMFAAGVRVDRPEKAAVSTISIDGNKNITGAQFATTGTPASGARADGILVQKFVKLDGSNTTLSGGAFGQNLNVIIGPTSGSIMGSPSTSSGSLLPGTATGVTIRGGGVRVQGTAAKPQTIAAGSAIRSSVGVRICDEDSYTTTVCKDGDTKVQYVQASGGAALQSAGISAQRVYGLVLDGLVARPGSLVPDQEKSRGIWLKDRNTGIVSDSYFFGLLPSSSAGDVEDRACALELDGAGTPPANSSLLFVHNTCVAGGAGSHSIGLYMDETGVASKKMPVTIANNLLAVGAPATRPIAWFRSRTAVVDEATQASSLTLTGNLLFSSPNSLSVALTKGGFTKPSTCSEDAALGAWACDASGASSYFYYELGSPQNPTNNASNGLLPGVSPYAGIYDPTPWMASGNCAALVGQAPAPVVSGGTNLDALSTDFLGKQRSLTSDVSRGPIVCNTGGT